MTSKNPDWQFEWPADYLDTGIALGMPQDKKYRIRKSLVADSWLLNVKHEHGGYTMFLCPTFQHALETMREHMEAHFRAVQAYTYAYVNRSLWAEDQVRRNTPINFKGIS